MLIPSQAGKPEGVTTIDPTTRKGDDIVWSAVKMKLQRLAEMTNLHESGITEREFHQERKHSELTGVTG